MEQEPQPIVLEVLEAVTDPPDLLGDQVLGFGGTVGDPDHVVAEDLGLPGRDGLGEAGDLWNLGLGGELIKLDELPAGQAVVLGRVHLAHELLGQDGHADFPVGITFVEGAEQLGQLAVTQSLEASGHEPPGSIERVVLVAPVPQGLVLDPTMHVVDHGVGELDAVKTGS